MQRHAEARLELGDPCVACPECCQALPEKDLRFDLKTLMPLELKLIALDTVQTELLPDLANHWPK
eukprot:396030-Amphidinium_carterae.1